MYNVIKILVINYLQKSLISTYSMHDILSSKHKLMNKIKYTTGKNKERVTEIN